MAQESSRIAAVAAVLGALAVGVGLGGVALAHFGVVAPLRGFGMFAFGGLLLGLLAVVTGAIGLFATRGVSGRAWFGLATGAAMLLVVLRGASAGAGLPRINDITTNPDDPPVFEYALRDPETRERDYSYPAGFAEQQRAGYPDLAPIALALPPDRAFEAALLAVRTLHFEVKFFDPARHVIEAREVSYLFRFVDDVAIRVRPGPNGGSVVDVRSKSRDGRGDLGANAKRIRAIAAQLASAR